MKVKYRGFEIDVRRARSMGGAMYVYFSVYGDEAHGFPCLADGFDETADTVRTYVSFMKKRVDDFYENPDDYEYDESEG